MNSDFSLNDFSSIDDLNFTAHPFSNQTYNDEIIFHFAWVIMIFVIITICFMCDIYY